LIETNSRTRQGIKMQKKTFSLILFLIFSLGVPVKSIAKNNPLKYGDIEYTVREYGPSANIRNSIFVPANLNGMAVAVLPSCTGIQDHSVSDLHRWTKLLLENNFVVSVTDYNAPGRPSGTQNCGKGGKTPHMRQMKDAYDAISALSKIPGVNSDKIFMLGFSRGAQIAGSAARGSMLNLATTSLNWGPKPRGIIGLYGACAYSASKIHVDASIATNILWMMGKHDVYYMKGCEEHAFEVIKMKNKHSKFIHFENASHCWDCIGLSGTFIAREGQTYVYNEKVTRQSEIEALQFMKQFE
jgi:dienelactone hydrolase